MLEKGLFPIEVGDKKNREKELRAKIDFVSYDEIKLDDSTFVIPPDIKIEPMK